MDALGDTFRTMFQVAWAAAFLGLLGFLFLVPLAMVVYTIMDVFNRSDMAAGKLVWVLVVLLVPFIGMAIYWLARPAPDQASYSEVSMRRTAQAQETAPQAAEQRRAA